MVAGVMSENRDLQLAATTGFRKLLSIERNPPINEVVQSGVVPRIVQFLSRDDFSQLHFEAVWALTNIASRTSADTKIIVDSGAVQLFVQLLSSPSEEVREQINIPAHPQVLTPRSLHLYRDAVSRNGGPSLGFSNQFFKDGGR